MGFDAKAFAAAFATEIAGGIKERTEEAKKFREEERAKAERNLTIFQKRMAQKDAVMTYANTLKKLGATDADIMYFAKDGPAVLKSIHDTISDKAEKYYNLTGSKLTSETVSKMMNIPKGFEEAASKYESLDKFLDAGYRLSQENDEFEQPENEEILAGNFLLGIMGVGAKERVKRKLETEKFIGDTTIGQLNRIAAQRDFVDVFGGEFSRAALDPTVGPRILDSNEVADIKNDTNLELVRKTTGTKGNNNLTAFMIDKLGKSEKTTKEITAIFAAMNDPTKEATLSKDQKGYLKEFKEKMLYNAFMEESAGMNLKPSEVAFFGKDIQEVYKTYAGGDTDTTDTTDKKDEVGDGTEKKDTKLSFKAQRIKMDEMITSGELKPGDVHVLTKEDGTTIEYTVPEVKTELEQEMDEVKTKEVLTKEAFDALEEQVESLSMMDQFNWKEQYGLTHFPDGRKRSYEEYLKNFKQDVMKKTTSLENKQKRLERIRKHKDKFKTGMAGP